MSIRLLSLLLTQAVSVLPLLAASTNAPVILPPEGGTNISYRLIWPTEPGLRYRVDQSANLTNWNTVNGFPVTAPGLADQLPFSVDANYMFFRVTQIDEQPPAIAAQSPANGGFAVKRFSPITINLQDQTGINPSTISLTVGALGTFTTNSTQLTFTNNTIVFDNGGVIGLGTYGQTITVALAVADVLGHNTTYNWSFDLEVEPQVVSSLFVFGSAQAQSAGQRVASTPMSALASRVASSPIKTKAAANPWNIQTVQPDRIILAYTDTAPVIAANTYLCNLTPVTTSEIFYRKVISISDDTANKLLTLMTTDVPLEEMVQLGSLSMSKESVVLSIGVGGVIQRAVSFDAQVTFAPIGISLDGASIKLRGTNDPITGMITNTGFSTTVGDFTLSVGGDPVWLSITAEELHWWLTPSIRTSLDIGLTGLKRFEGVIRGDVDTAIVLDTDVLLLGATSDWTIFDIPEASEPSLWVLIGTIGPVPVYAQIKFDLKLIAKAEARADLNFRTGIRQGASAEFGIQYERDGNPAVTWVNDLTFAPTDIVRPQFALNGELSLKLKLEPSVSLLVYGLAGAEASIAPRGGVVFETDFSQKLTGRFEADVSLNLKPAGPALDWLDPKPTLSINLWNNQWHLFPQEEALAILKQPVSTTVQEGQSVRLTVDVNRTEGVAYQWYFQGGIMPHKTQPYLDLLNVNRFHAGDYFVRVKAGSTTLNSAIATLTVNPPPLGITPSGMAFIPAGSFTMGDAFGEGSSSERPTHVVYVSELYMDRTEVTKALWDEVYIWAITHGYSFEYGAQGKASTHPAHSMTWYDAIKWCNVRSEKEGRTPAYYTDTAQTIVYRSGQVNVQNGWVKWNAGYRLPTEAEWEKAARGGADGRRFPWVDTDTITHSRANYYSSTSYAYDTSTTRGYHPTYMGGRPYTSPVGSFAANGYGLYDMAGNVWEWCWDWYGSSYYSSSPGTDPRGPSSGWDRVGRGSNFSDGASACRSARRYGTYPTYQYSYFGFIDGGFRAVLPPGQP